MLGIDAAWTERQPSGVALIARRSGRWRCLRVSPSYEAFCSGAWPETVHASAIDIDRILSTAGELLGGATPQVVAVDMPIGAGRVRARRCADNEISTRFGHAKCAVHSPTVERPGAVGHRLSAGFLAAGYTLACTHEQRTAHSLIEVYPHVALLALMSRPQRLPYKAHKTLTYWKDAAPDVRRRALLEVWQAILAQLSARIDGIELRPPSPDSPPALGRLKAYEDALDALICAWVGALYFEGRARPMGDAESAIWVPEASMRFARVNFSLAQPASAGSAPPAQP